MVVRSHCPVNYGLGHFGDKWTLLIVRDLMFKGKRHYNEFLEGGEHVSTSVLGSRLKHLVEVGVITKGEDEEKKSRIKYSLTQKGIDMLPFMVELILWSGAYDSDTEAGEDFLTQAKHDRQALIEQIRSNLLEEHLAKQ